ncbi:DUF1003 domain-containing protein [Pseudoduganella sp. GCM10020061]|uniref:DUF1003 domain-containing protein n=1 Tax=Pseudoduganella sp. GCM10020061 TaxID=3317345 RepID=UPI003630495E
MPPIRDNDEPLPRAVSENIETIAEFCALHEMRKSAPQTMIERFSYLVGSPGYILASVAFIVAWVAYNVLAGEIGASVIDEPPFFWLQGIIAVNAFVISTTVLIRQNHAAKLAEHHTNLDLQVSLLTEKKTSKIIELLEQLRQETPTAHHDRDAEAEELQRPANARAVLSAIDEERP